jgi:hypothetical protein
LTLVGRGVVTQAAVAPAHTGAALRPGSEEVFSFQWQWAGSPVMLSDEQ